MLAGYGTMEICSRYVSSSHERLIMTPGQVANGDNLRNVFVFCCFFFFVFFFYLLDILCMLSVLIRIASIMRF